MQVLSGFRDQFLRWLRPVHRKLRRQKVDLFLRLVGDASAEDTLLDVGGGTGIDGEFLALYLSFSRVVAVNLDTRHFQIPTSICVKTVEADGRNLPFKSKSFDWVFSNAVIEHVGGWARQRELSSTRLRDERILAQPLRSIRATLAWSAAAPARREWQLQPSSTAPPESASLVT